MNSIELLAVNWDRPDDSSVLRTIQTNSSSPADLNLVARQQMAEDASCDGYRIKDDEGGVFIVYREKKL
ncbi:MAG: hypothetical protein K8H74_01375 [Notoacmeibacter sp.]|nr:hypothetical protein [Notoacmeibacter sp.]